MAAGAPICMGGMVGAGIMAAGASICVGGGIARVAYEDWDRCAEFGNLLSNTMRILSNTSSAVTRNMLSKYSPRPACAKSQTLDHTEIMFRTLEGEHHKASVPDTMQFGVVKKEIVGPLFSNAAPECIMLIFEGLILEDEMTVRSVGCEAATAVHVVITDRTSAKPVTSHMKALNRGVQKMLVQYIKDCNVGMRLLARRMGGVMVLDPSLEDIEMVDQSIK